MILKVLSGIYVDVPGKSSCPSVVVGDGQAEHDPLHLRVNIPADLTGGQIPGYESMFQPSSKVRNRLQ